MTNLEIVLNLLAEITTAELCKTHKPVGMQETKKQAIIGGTVAGNTRKDIESRLGHSAISIDNTEENQSFLKKTKKISKLK